MEKKQKIILTSVVVVIAILSFFIGFLIGDNIHNTDEKILQGSRDKLIGDWYLDREGSSNRFSFYQNGSIKTVNSWGRYEVNGDIITVDSDSDTNTVRFYFLYNYDILVLESLSKDGEIIVTLHLFRE